MQAAVVQSFDAPPRFRSFGEPVAGPGEKVVEVSAAALHQLVRGQASGKHYSSPKEPPFVPGADGVGRLEDGTRVYFMAARVPFGSMAERSLAAERMCLALPEQLADAFCAAMANPALSSWTALSARARFVAGERVLVLGATGVSGRMAVQIAKRRGAGRVVAVARDEAALEEVQALGADAVISLRGERDEVMRRFKQELAGAGVDVVLDYLWGGPAEMLLEAIAAKGVLQPGARVRYVQIGGSAGPAIALPAQTLRSCGLELLGSGLGSASMAEIRQAVAEFFAAAAEKPFVAKIELAPLRDVEQLWNEQLGAARRVFLP